MELERIKKDLELKNDINVLKIDELIDKYAKHGDEAAIFLSRIAKLYEGAFYPLYMLDKHIKVENIIGEIYENNRNEENRSYVNFINERIAREFRSFTRWDDAYDFQAQAEFMLNHRLGGTNFNNKMGLSYENMCKTLYDKLNEFENIVKYDDTYVHSSSLVEQYNCIAKGKPYGGVVYSKDTLYKFYDNIPIMNLCFDKEYLLLANYLLQSNIVSEDDKEHLVDITNDVIYISLNCNPIGEKSSSFNKREYARVAKKTRSNIKEYEEKLNNDLEKNKKLKKSK